MKIRKSQLREAVNEQVQAFFVTPPSMGMVGIKGNTESAANQLEEDDIDKNELKNIISKIVDDVQDAATNRMKSGAAGRGDHTGKLTEATKWYDQIKRPVEVGDKVHIGHIKKGGAGVSGIVTKIKGDRVDIKDPKSKRTFYGSLKKTAIMEISGVDSLKPNDPHTPEDEAEKDAADDVMEAGPKKKGGRPRGAPHIENVRFWDLPEKSLRYIIKDAGEAIAANPLSRKATGKWADEVNDAVSVLHWRKKKGIKVEGLKEGTWAIPDTQEKYNELKKLMKRPIILGKGAKKATDNLYHLTGDDKLFDQLGDAADEDPKGDARPYVKEFLKLWARDLKKKGIKEGWKLGGLTSKILNDRSTIKMVNPKNPREIFVIFSRLQKGGGKQDKISMAVVDKTGRVITDWGSHVNVKGALKFAQTRGFTKKVDESFNTAPQAQGKEQASVIGTNESPEMGSLAGSPKSKALIKQMHELVTKKLKFKTVEDIQPIQGGVAFIFGDKAEASKMEKYLKNAGALGKVIPLRGGKRTMVSLRAK